jgi:hypothetical protein
MSAQTENRPYGPEAIERGDLPAALDPASPPASELIDFMGEYFRVWNAKDAKGLATRIYRFGPGFRLQTEADFQKLLDDVAAEGWDYSTLDEIAIHPWDGEGYLANGLFSRFTAKGELLPPGRRPTAYVIRRFPDGWRFTDLPLVYRD